MSNPTIGNTCTAFLDIYRQYIFSKLKLRFVRSLIPSFFVLCLTSSPALNSFICVLLPSYTKRSLSSFVFMSYLHYFGHGGISFWPIFLHALVRVSFVFPNLLLPHYVSWKGWVFLFKDTVCLVLFTIVTTRGQAEETLSLLLSLWPVWVNHLLQVWHHSSCWLGRRCL